MSNMHSAGSLASNFIFASSRGLIGSCSKTTWATMASIAVTLIVITQDSHAEPRRPSDASRPNRVAIEYGKPATARQEEIYRLLKDHQALEKIRDVLRPLRLPHRLLLQTRSCDGISNAWSDDETVTVCYEYIDDIWKAASDKTTPAGL